MTKAQMIAYILLRKFRWDSSVQDTVLEAVQDTGCTVTDELVLDHLFTDFSLSELQFRSNPALADEDDDIFKEPDVSKWREEVRSWIATVTQHRNRLEQLSTAELKKGYYSERKIELEEIDETLFFNRRKADARIEKWRKLAAWTIDEAVALSFGKEPAVVNLKSLSVPPRSLSPLTSSPFVRRYRERTDRVSRAHAAGLLGNPINPTKYVKWLKSEMIEAPAAIVGMFEKHTDPEYVQGKERTSFYTLILGMAVCNYGLDKDQATVPKALSSGIADDIRFNAGIKIDTGTVEKHLEAALAAASGKGWKGKARSPTCVARAEASARYFKR